MNNWKRDIVGTTEYYDVLANLAFIQLSKYVIDARFEEETPKKKSAQEALNQSFDTSKDFLDFIQDAGWNAGTLIFNELSFGIR